MSDILEKVYVEPTTACNLNCVMCVRSAWNESIGCMPLATFRRLVDQLTQFDPPPTLHLSGYGEPMMHPHFVEMAGYAKAAGLCVEATTNGMLLSSEVAEALIEFGFDRLVVSLDGACPEHYEGIRERASFQTVIDNLARLKHLRIQRRGRHGAPQLALAFVAMRSNIADLPQLPALATRLGALQILVSNVVPHTPEMEREILYRDALTACAYRASRWAPELSLPRIDLGSEVIAPVSAVFRSRASISLLGTALSERTDFCPFVEQGYAAVRWDGEVAPCLSLLHDHPEYIRGRRKWVAHHSFGNIAQLTLRDIWQSMDFCEFRERLCRFHFSPCTTCGGCERFPYNLEDCIGNGFPTCGGCLWSQGFVQCA